MNDKVKVLPNVVVLFLMVLKALFGIFIKHSFVYSANETCVLSVSDNSDVNVSQLSESIDNNTENDVEQDCNDKQEE